MQNYFFLTSPIVPYFGITIKSWKSILLAIRKSFAHFDVAIKLYRDLIKHSFNDQSSIQRNPIEGIS